MLSVKQRLGWGLTIFLCGLLLWRETFTASSLANLLHQALPPWFVLNQPMRSIKTQNRLSLPSANVNKAARRSHYQEDFSTTQFKQQTENVNWDSGQHALTLTLRDQIRQQEASIATNSTANFIYIVWRDFRADDGDIYAQRIDAAGNRLWPSDYRINTDVGAATQFDPTAAVDSNGNLWVAWVDNRDNNNDIFVQRMGAQGEKLWTEDKKINDDENNADQGGVSLTLFSSEKALVAWHDNRMGNYDVYARTIDAAGAPGWAHSLRVNNDNTTTTQTYPAAAIDPNGEIVITWLDQRIGNSDIYAQRISAAGQFFWSADLQVNQIAEAAQSRPRVAINSYNETWIGWTAMSGGHFYVQQVDAKGQLQRASALSISQVHEPVDPNQPPALLAIADGTFVAAWIDSTSGYLYAQRFSRQGTLLWLQEQQIQSQSPEKRVEREALSLGSTANGLILAAWMDKRVNSDGDIYTQALDFSGKRQWAQDALINAQSGKVDQLLAATAVDKSGEQVIVWQDWRSGAPALYVQRLTADGKPLWSDHVHASAVATQTGNLVADVAMIGSDAIVTWADNRSGGARLYAQRFDRAGNRQWYADQLVSRTTDPTVSQLNPSLVTDQAGRIFVAWEEIKQNSKQIAVQQLDPNGVAVWSNDLFIPTVAKPQLPALAAGQDGNIYLVWIEVAADEANLYVQYINVNGQLTWAAQRRVNHAAGEVNAYNPPAIGANLAGNISVAWVNRSNSAVMAQRIDTAGQQIWPKDVQVNATPSAFAPLPALAVLPSGDTIVVWQQLYEKRYSIAAQRLDQNGNLAWQPTLPNTQAVIVSLQAADAQRPQIATDSQDNSIIVWQDRRFKNWDVVAQRLSSAGEIIWPEDSPIVPAEKFYWAAGSVASSGIAQTNATIMSAVASANLQENGGKVAFWLSNNGGVAWEAIQLGIPHTFHTAGSDLRWKAVLQADPHNLAHAPVLQMLTIDYDTENAAGADAYEMDNTCNLARPLQINGVPQSHTLTSSSAQALDEDWTALTLDQNGEFTVIAQVQENGLPIQLTLHQACGSDGWLTTLSSVDGSARITFTGTAGSVVYARIQPNAAIATQAIGYSLSAYKTMRPGVVVIAAGHMPSNPAFDEQIDQVATRAYLTLLAHGYTTSTVYFLSSNATQDVNNDGNNDVDAPLSTQAIQYAVEAWPRTFPQEQASTLLLFVIGQGGSGQFQAAEGQLLAPANLDLWLTNLENARELAQIAVVLEMNQAGLWLHGGSALAVQADAALLKTVTLAGKKRIILTATHDQGAAWYTPVGALFSDIFWTALNQGASLGEGAERARLISEQINYRCQPLTTPCQVVWLDDDGDASANAPTDGALAHQWRLPPFTTPTGPIIQQVQIQPTSKSASEIKATMLRVDPQTIVEAHLLPPTYTVALPTNGSPPTFAHPIIRLTASQPPAPGGDPAHPTLYSGVYDGFTQIGHYQIIVYAWNGKKATALPKVVNFTVGSTLYLPSITVTNRTR